MFQTTEKSEKSEKTATEEKVRYEFSKNSHFMHAEIVQKLDLVLACKCLVENPYTLKQSIAGHISLQGLTGETNSCLNELYLIIDQMYMQGFIVFFVFMI